MAKKKEEVKINLSLDRLRSIISEIDYYLNDGGGWDDCCPTSDDSDISVTIYEEGKVDICIPYDGTAFHSFEY